MPKSRKKEQFPNINTFVKCKVNVLCIFFLENKMKILFKKIFFAVQYIHRCGGHSDILCWQNIKVDEYHQNSKNNKTQQYVITYCITQMCCCIHEPDMDALHKQCD